MTTHLSSLAALFKTAHPNWSPAMIKSTIMTATNPINLINNPIEDQTLQPTNIFVIDSGHVNLSKATDLGLVYDI